MASATGGSSSVMTVASAARFGPPSSSARAAARAERPARSSSRSGTPTNSTTDHGPIPTSHSPRSSGTGCGSARAVAAWSTYSGVAREIVSSCGEGELHRTAPPGPGSGLAGVRHVLPRDQPQRGRRLVVAGRGPVRRPPPGGRIRLGQGQPVPDRGTARHPGATASSARTSCPVRHGLAASRRSQRLLIRGGSGGRRGRRGGSVRSSIAAPSSLWTMPGRRRGRQPIARGFQPLGKRVGKVGSWSIAHWADRASAYRF